MLYKLNGPISQRINRVFEFKVNDKNVRKNESGRLYFSHILAVGF